jgi:hypothetical protein
VPPEELPNKTPPPEKPSLRRQDVGDDPKRILQIPEIGGAVLLGGGTLGLTNDGLISISGPGRVLATLLAAIAGFAAVIGLRKKVRKPIPVVAFIVAGVLILLSGAVVWITYSHQQANKASAYPPSGGTAGAPPSSGTAGGRPTASRTAKGLPSANNAQNSYVSPPPTPFDAKYFHSTVTHFDYSGSYASATRLDSTEAGREFLATGQGDVPSGLIQIAVDQFKLNFSSQFSYSVTIENVNVISKRTADPRASWLSNLGGGAYILPPPASLNLDQANPVLLNVKTKDTYFKGSIALAPGETASIAVDVSSVMNAHAYYFVVDLQSPSGQELQIPVWDGAAGTLFRLAPDRPVSSYSEAWLQTMTKSGAEYYRKLTPAEQKAADKKYP